MKTRPHIPIYGWFSPLRVLLALTLVLFFSLSAHAVLYRVGPNDVPSPPGNGYPLWYQDTNGLVLDLCLPQNQLQINAGVCLILPPDQDPVAGLNHPIVFPTNYPDEAFYWNATAVMDIDANNRAVLVLGLEAAFATGPVVPGDQVTFGRVRIIVDTPVAGTYTVTHPFGIQVFPNVPADQRGITFTSDIGIGAPGDFTGALGSGVGPFLRASANAGGAPLPYFTVPNDPSGDQFLADTAATVAVTGSPFGTNFFRICVDAVGGLDGNVNTAGDECMQIDQFTLMGKVHTGLVGSPLTIDRSTYSRDANGAHVEVYATATPQPNAGPPRLFFGDAGGTNLMPSKFMRGPTTQGLFYGQSIPGNAATLPANVIVTNVGDNPPSSATRALVDEVKIITASYHPGIGTLTIRATSSDKVAPPTLTVIGLPGSATGSDVMQLDNSVPTDPARYILTYPVPGIGGVVLNRVPPLNVTVVSSAGGQSTEPVLTTFAATAAGLFSNGGPVAVDDTVSVVAGSAPSVAINVVANDAGYELGPGRISIPVQPQSGSVAVNQNTGVITYTFPAQVVPGEVTFAYLVRNANGVRSNTATVTVITTPAQQ